MNNYFLKKNGKVYIISGQFKGRKISFNNTPNLRPTTNRIRETLFNWLSTHIRNARCLDCFSGSGALGIEAISRHAAFATLLEIEKNTVRKLKKTAKELKIYNLEIINTNTLNWLKKNGQAYDVVFIDPPYNTGLIKKTITLLEKNQWLKKNSLVYIEKEQKKSIITPKNWLLYKKKTTSQIECYLYILNA